MYLLIGILCLLIIFLILKEIKKTKEVEKQKERIEKATVALEAKELSEGEFWLEAQKAYAEAIGKHKQVPDIQFGEGTSGQSGGDVMLQAMGINALKQLSLDLDMKTK